MSRDDRRKSGRPIGSRKTSSSRSREPMKRVKMVEMPIQTKPCLFYRVDPKFTMTSMRVICQ